MAVSAALVVPAAGFVLLRTRADLDGALVAPEQHFYIVSAVSLMSAALALMAAIAALRLANERLILLSLSFLSMAGFFSVHGLATPSFILEHEYHVIGFSARLSLVASAAFLAASAVGLPSGLARAVVSRRGTVLAGWTALLVVYGFVGLRFPGRIPPQIVSDDLFLRGTLVTTLALSLFAAWRYFRGYLLTRGPMYAAVALGSALVFEAQISMHFGTVWAYSWWLYHAVLVAGFGSVLWGVVVEYARGSSLFAAVASLGVGDPLAQVQSGYGGSVQGLAAALEARDGYTLGHGRRVSVLALLMGERLNLSAVRLRALVQGAFLHDIGKIAVPDGILHKPGKLEADEYDVVKGHSARGEDILESSGISGVELAIVRHHHERFDGRGYPDGLAGEGIPLEARIVAVADVYDSLRSDRAYRAAWRRDEARDFIRRAAGVEFDPSCVEAFLAVVDRWEEQCSSGADRVIAGERGRSSEAHHHIA